MEKIDTHCHIIPSGWRRWCEQYGWDKPDGMPEIPAWSPESHIKLMNQLHIKQSILSITSPGTHLKVGDVELARRITRETNDEIATVCRQFPDRFKFFASLPLPDVDGSMEEIDRMVGQEGCCGFALMTNAEGYYLGDPRFDPIMQKLNEHKAVIFMHPAQCCSIDNPGADKPLPQYPTPMLEFFFDTTRAVVNLLLTGTVSRYENLTFLVSHCGATLPPVVERVARFSGVLLKDSMQLSSNQVKEIFRTRFYFDLAGMPFPDLIHGYLRIGSAGRLLYGSDYPYTPGNMVEALSDTMDEGLRDLVDDKTRKAIYSGNAQALFGG
ncbi:hypothetical protein FE257_009147 [Aspergillus nanangensis]|uniref:6-methylsalicylate decarboxylase n=1 Tax=Aspergillus nanangensis TaxID=2582783 RepID=A0AAD4CWU9_ASPNN|nr:hypothetical protein FE257_009147 [Aspergillus nanangensis]